MLSLSFSLLATRSSSRGRILGTHLSDEASEVFEREVCRAAVVSRDVLQIAMANQDEPSLFLFNPAFHAGAGDVTPMANVRGN